MLPDFSGTGTGYVRYRMKDWNAVKIDMLSVISSVDGDSRGESERSETTYEGELRLRGEGILLTYSETTEGGELKTEISVTDGEVRVRRRGAIRSDMRFREGESATSFYEIPPYSFDMEIYCKRAKISVEEHSGRVDLLYEMKVGGDVRAARMRIIWN